ncbi:hypothetical protein LIER_01873 [Lithospermum erythrorhizon]|uniref:Uncharacterized protein n=1 Tax=Lithospermum erythrorhizon TaxID=34254 RepID=A0AAV3NNS6_LITER
MQFFGLQGVVLQSYEGLLSSYEKASGSSSRTGQLEGELKALKKEMAREECVPQPRLKNLAGERRLPTIRSLVGLANRNPMPGADHEGHPGRQPDPQGTGEQVRSSDAGRDLLFQHFSLERTIRAVQARLEEEQLEVPSTIWDSVRDDVSSPPSNL